MLRSIIRLGLAAVPMFLLAPLYAQQQSCSNGTFPLTSTNWNSTLTIPRFDPAQGTLTGVTFTINGGIAGQVGIESTDSAATVVTTNFQATVNNNGITPTNLFNSGNPYPNGLLQPAGASLGLLSSTGDGQSFDHRSP